jgi:hypothetical protein
MDVPIGSDVRQDWHALPYAPDDGFRQVQCYESVLRPIGAASSSGVSEVHVPTTNVWPERLTRGLYRVTRLLQFRARRMCHERPERHGKVGNAQQKCFNAASLMALLATLEMVFAGQPLYVAFA